MEELSVQGGERRRETIQGLCEWVDGPALALTAQAEMLATGSS